MIYQREIKENNEYDVIVAGGGPSGCAAAAASAREGKKTLLIESDGFLGGMATSGLVPAWCPFSDGEKIIYKGLAERVFRAATKPMAHIDENRQFDWIPIDAEVLKRVYDEMMLEFGVDTMFHSTVCDTVCNGAKLEKIIVSNKAGLTAYSAKMFIDCTGDADLAVGAGAEYHFGDGGEVQPSTMCFTIANVDQYYYPLIGNMYPSNENSKVFDMIADEKYPLITDNHMCQSLIGDGVVGFNAGHIFGVDNTDPMSVSSAEIQGRQLAFQLHSALAEYCPKVYGNSHLVQTSPRIGVRESRRIVGEYVFTIDDYLARRSFDDEIGRNCYYIDIHKGEQEAKAINNRDAFNKMESDAIRYKRGESHGIPYRCLVPKGVDNVLVAGRSISSDRIVQGSVRVMPTCLVTGEAAGVAAAVCCDSGAKAKNADVALIREKLSQNGCMI